MSKKRPAPKGFVHAEEARERILKGTAPDDVKVVGELVLRGIKTPLRLPERLSASSLTLDACDGVRALPRGMNVRQITLAGDWDPAYLLEGLHHHSLTPPERRVRSLPPSLHIGYPL